MARWTLNVWWFEWNKINRSLNYIYTMIRHGRVHLARMLGHSSFISFIYDRDNEVYIHAFFLFLFLPPSPVPRVCPPGTLEGILFTFATWNILTISNHHFYDPNNIHRFIHMCLVSGVNNEQNNDVTVNLSTTTTSFTMWLLIVSYYVQLCLHLVKKSTHLVMIFFQ